MESINVGHPIDNASELSQRFVGTFKPLDVSLFPFAIFDVKFHICSELPYQTSFSVSVHVIFTIFSLLIIIISIIYTKNILLFPCKFFIFFQLKLSVTWTRMINSIVQKPQYWEVIVTKPFIGPYFWGYSYILLYDIFRSCLVVAERLGIHILN